LSDDADVAFRTAAEHFGLPGLAAVAKDMHVVRAIRAITQVDARPFTLVFGGGTALARAHGVVRRMSEDVDFKVVLMGASLSRNVLRQALGALRGRVSDALLAAGFMFDPADGTVVRSRNENRYTIYQLPYVAGGGGEALRPTVQVELTYAVLRFPPVTRTVSSFVNEAFARDAEVPAILCVSLAETAAEKLVALTRRTAMDLAGLSRDADPALVRHLYDLHLMRDLIDRDVVAAMAKDIAAADAVEFRNQYPAYHADIAGETGKALNALRSAPVYRMRYDGFVAAMVYGEAAVFDDAIATVTMLANQALT
jgi:predicted nucleotidyltransferase component of viral defense system